MNVINESSLSRIWQKYKEHDSGTISASRGENTKKQNQTLTLALKTELIKLGYSVTKVKGKFIENYKRKLQNDTLVFLIILVPRINVL